MDLNELIQSLADIVTEGREQLYTVEDRRSTLENLEQEIQDAVSSLDYVMGGLDEATETVRTLEDDLIPEANRLTGY